MQEELASLDRLIISNNDSLNKGNTLVVKCLDGYISIERQCDKNGEQRTSVYFAEFDDVLDIKFKEIINEDLKEYRE